MKQKSWISIVFSFAAQCRLKIILSVLCAIISVIAGLVPYLSVYQIITQFIGGAPIMETLCLALCVLWNFHNTFAYLGLYDFRKYSFKSDSALDESTSGNGLGGICRKAEKCIGRPR